MPQNLHLPSFSHLTDYVLIPDLFSPEECQEIIYAPLPATQAQVIKYDEVSFHQLSLEQRNTKVKAIIKAPAFEWIYQRVIQQVHAINHQYYQFEIKDMSHLQLLEYENTGFYDSHVDIGTGESSNRKISMVAFLSERSDYEGGELLLKPGYPELPQSIGSAVFFPSYILHEIRPVLSGIRHTLVTWVLGPCFK